MTITEQKQHEKNAAEVALVIGGWLAIFLQVKTTRHVVEFRDGRFYLDGKRVAIHTIRGLLLKIETSVGREIAAITRKLETGEWDNERWREEIMKLIGASHVLTGALAAGSIAAAAANPTVQQRIEKQKSFLSRFADSLLAGAIVGVVFSGAGLADLSGLPGTKPISARRVRSRAKSYLRAVLITYSQVEQRVQQALGKTEAKRIRRASESCLDCIDWSGRWVPIGQMPLIGTLRCGGFCKCYLVYR